MKLKPLPKHGEERTRICFALLPTQCDDGTRRWLERLRVSETFDVYLQRWFRYDVRPANEGKAA